MDNSNRSSTASNTTLVPTDSTDPLYVMFGHAGFVPSLVSTNGFLSLLCAIGFLFNLSLVLITAKSSSLRGHCNLLLAFGSLSISPLLLCSTVKFWVLLSGVNFIPLRPCYYLLLPGLIGAGLSTSSQLCIGLDRLASVLFPFWYASGEHKTLLKILLFFCVIRAFVLNILYFSSATLHADKLVMCSPGDVVGQEIGNFIYREGLVLFCSEFLCYFLVWLVILLRNNQNADLKRVRRLMKSLTVIMCISFFCYIQGNSWRVILPLVNFSPLDTEYYVSFPTTCLYMIAFSSNAPILYLFSKKWAQQSIHATNNQQQQQRTNTNGQTIK